MQRFILRENIRRFEKALESTEAVTRERITLLDLLAHAHHDLGLIEKIWRVTCPHLDIPDGWGERTEDLLERAVEIQHADFGSLHLFDQGTDRQFLVAQRNFTASFTLHCGQVLPGDGSLYDIARRGGCRMISIIDLAADDRFAAFHHWVIETGIRSVIAIPILDIVGRPAGTLCFYFFAKGIQLPSADSKRLIALFTDLFSQLHP